MKGNSATHWVAIATVLIVIAGLALAEERTWTDNSGEFSVSAELVLNQANPSGLTWVFA